MEKKTSSSIAQWQGRLQIAGVAAAGLLLSACGGGGSSSPSAGFKATGCLNADLYDVGTHVDESTLSPTEAVHTDSTVTQKTSFNDVPNLTETEALEEKGLPQAPQIIYQTRTLQRYTRLEGTTLRTFGDVTTASTADLVTDPVLAPFQDPLLTSVLYFVQQLPLVSDVVTVVVTVTNNPAIEKRFDLSPGQSYTQSYSTKSSTNAVVAGLSPILLPVLEYEPVSVKTTYVGRESVTVPAGTFEACKFIDELTPQGGNTTMTTTWLAVGSGLFLKSDTATGASTQLVDATINDDPIR